MVATAAGYLVMNFSATPFVSLWSCRLKGRFQTDQHPGEYVGLLVPVRKSQCAAQQLSQKPAAGLADRLAPHLGSQLVQRAALLALAVSFCRTQKHAGIVGLRDAF